MNRKFNLEMLKVSATEKNILFNSKELAERIYYLVMITYESKKYVIELKIGRGPTAHQKGLE